MVNFATKKQKKSRARRAKPLISMGLDNIQLSSKTIVELYKDTLVELEKHQTEPTAEKSAPLPVMGKNATACDFLY